MRGATGDHETAVWGTEFQSTLLMRGATARRHGKCLLETISIHAPHARSDKNRNGAIGKVNLFQSTLLMRGATSYIGDACQALCISIHAPHARSDVSPCFCWSMSNISIHAPHARSDQLIQRVVDDLAISIHDPHARSDEFLLRDADSHKPFQSTLLMRGATTASLSMCLPSTFQSTLLMRGATDAWLIQCGMAVEFQSTLLMRGATYTECEDDPDNDISIHAPHARSDKMIKATWGSASIISIHAPHARSDSVLSLARRCELISIHAPHARSDASCRRDTACPCNFNPRSSCEERR